VYVHFFFKFLREKKVLHIEKFPSFVLPRNAIMLQHLIIQFPPYYLSSGHLQEVKNKRKFQNLSSEEAWHVLNCIMAGVCIFLQVDLEGIGTRRKKRIALHVFLRLANLAIQLFKGKER